MTSSGEDGWVIPEFAWDPSGRRLLWTENKIGTERRVDQGCVMRKIRADIIGRLSGVRTFDKIPFDIVPQIRAQALSLLDDPKAFPFQGFDCGGTDPTQPPHLTQRSRIGHYE